MATAKSTSSKARSTVKTSRPKAAVENTPTSTNPTIKERIARHKVVIIVVLVVLFGIGYLLYTNRGLVVAATVNGEPIYRLNLLTTTEKAYGPQVLDNLIQQKIIEQEAARRGITASDEELNLAFQELSTQLQEVNGQDIQVLMQQSGTTESEVKESLRPQVLEKNLIASEGIVVTDEEVDAFIEGNPDILPEDPEEQVSVRENLKLSLESQKATEFLNSLRTNANIDYFVGQ